MTGDTVTLPELRDTERRFLLEHVLGVAEVADLLEVGRDTVRKWRSRSSSRFPDPAVRLAATPIWLRGDVEDWALATGRLVTVVSDDGATIAFAVPPRR